jgi:predicted GIY-YIG superfamily endonuclease
LEGEVSERTKEHARDELGPRRPLKLIYYEGYVMKEDAYKREAFLKTSEGKKSLRRQLTAYLHKQGEVLFEE